MAEPKDTTSFFRKVVKFVANPATEWAELDVPNDETRENDYAKGELKAMIERKRRNDFVRKREFDMLRKVRREGLSGEQLAALGGSSRIDDSQPRISDQPVRQDAGVKAKIDEIEQQMVGDGYSNTQRRAPEFYNAPTQPAPLDLSKLPPAAIPAQHGGRVEDFVTAPAPAPSPPAPAPAPAPQPLARASVAPLHLEMPKAEDFGKAFSAANTEVTHDPDLDEAVIAFANADFEQCEQALSGLTGLGGNRVAARRDLARPVRPLPRHRPAAQVREPRPRLRAAVRLVGAAMVLDAQAGRRGGERRAAEQLARRGPGRLGLSELPRRRRRRAALVAGPADAAAVGVRLGRAGDDRRRGDRPPLRALPQLDAAGPRHALALGRPPVHGAAGSGADRRARRRPGVLAAAPRRAAHDATAPTISTRRRSTTASPTRSRRRRGKRRAASSASRARTRARRSRRCRS